MMMNRIGLGSFKRVLFWNLLRLITNDFTLWLMSSGANLWFSGFQMKMVSDWFGSILIFGFFKEIAVWTCSWSSTPSWPDEFSPQTKSSWWSSFVKEGNELNHPKNYDQVWIEIDDTFQDQWMSVSTKNFVYSSG